MNSHAVAKGKLHISSIHQYASECVKQLLYRSLGQSWLTVSTSPYMEHISSGKPWIVSGLTKTMASSLLLRELTGYFILVEVAGQFWQMLSTLSYNKCPSELFPLRLPVWFKANFLNLKTTGEYSLLGSAHLFLHFFHDILYVIYVIKFSVAM